MAAPKRRATYEDLMQVPDTKVAEILDGELFLSPRPASPQLLATSALCARLITAFDREPAGPDHPGGWWILREPELHFGADVVVPDLVGWQHERLPRLPDVPWLELAPDWLCETLSPITACIDRTRKLRIYAREGVRFVWFLDPLTRTLEVLTLDRDRWIVAENHGGDEVVRAAPFAAIGIDLARFWID